jgi:hypothetical protein
MQKGKIWLFALIVAASPAFAQGDSSLDARRAAVHELFAVRGEDRLIKALIDSLADNYVARLQQLHPDMRRDTLETLRKGIEANLESTKDGYQKQEIELLSERLSLDDLHAVIAFYKTPAGKRLSDVAPLLIPEAGKNQSIWVNAAVHKATVDLNATVKVTK